MFFLHFLVEIQVNRSSMVKNEVVLVTVLGVLRAAHYVDVGA